MRHVLFWAAALAASAAALCLVPLFGRLGYEHAVGMAPLAALAGAHLGAHAPDLRTATWRALVVLVPALVLVSLHGVRVQVCDWAGALAFHLLLPGVGAAIGAAWGRAGRVLLRLPGRGAALAVVAGVLSLAVAAWRIVMEPPIFAYDPVFGFWPGALYDEALGIPSALAPARLLHLLSGWAALAVARLVRTPAPERASPAAFAPPAILVAAVAGLAGQGPALGFRHDHGTIAAALGRTDVFGEAGAPWLTLHADRGLSDADVQALADDVRWRRTELAGALRLDEAAWPPLEVFAFRSAAQRRRLMGADAVAVARPWLGQVYVVAPEPGDPLLAHELVHGLAAALTDNPSGMPWIGAAPAIGLVEGLAVALAGVEEGPSLDEAVAGMRALGLAPSPGDLLSAAGFYAEPAARAYAVMGSFVGWLLNVRGTDALRRAYSSGDLAAATGDPLPALVAAWSDHLGSIHVSDELRALAEVVYGRGAIFHRVCPHEVALRRREADALAARDPAGAARLWESVVRWDPGDAGHLLHLSAARSRADDLDGARAAARACADHAGAPPALRRQAAIALADLAWQAGDAEGAAQSYADAVGRVGRPHLDRLVRAKAETARRPPGPGRDAVAAWLFDAPAPEAGLLALAEAWRTDGWGLPAYLIGRRLFTLGAFAEAGPWFLRAEAAGLPDPVLAAENLRLGGRAAYRAGRWEDARDGFARLAAAAPTEGYAEGARSWRRRLEWHLQRGR